MHYEKEQNVYSIIKTVEYLEWAYMCGKIKGPEYDLEFKKLLHMFNMSRDAMQGFNLEQFIKKYALEHCQTAKMRIASGQGAYKGEDAAAGIAVRVMDITSKFIGALDQLELEIYDIDQVQPAIIDIKHALMSFPNISPTRDCVVRIEKWVEQL